MLDQFFPLLEYAFYATLVGWHILASFFAKQQRKRLIALWFLTSMLLGATYMIPVPFVEPFLAVGLLFAVWALKAESFVSRMEFRDRVVERGRMRRGIM